MFFGPFGAVQQSSSVQFCLAMHSQSDDTTMTSQIEARPNQLAHQLAYDVTN